MMTQDSCLICKMPLFDKKGKRLTAECYGVHLIRKRADSHGTYADCGKGSVYLCTHCFNYMTLKSYVAMFNALKEQKEHSDKIETGRILQKGDWICR